MNFFYFFLQTDKQKHFIISLLLFVMFILIRRYLLKRKWLLKELSFSLRDVLVIWIMKEIIDLFWFWHPELLDLFADSFWLILVFYFYYLFKEWKNAEENDRIFNLEAKLIDKLKDKSIILYKRFILYAKINYKVLFYKRKIMYYIPNKTRKFLLKRSLFEFSELLEYFFFFSIVWLINLFVLIVKIPVIAFYDAIKSIIWMIKYSFDFKKSDLKNVA